MVSTCSFFISWLQAVPVPRDYLSIVAPVSEIPKWFMYQNEGSSITVTRPSYLYNMNKVVGFAICCVFHVPKHSTRVKNLWRSSPGYQLNCRMIDSNMRYCTNFRDRFAQAVSKSDHLWLLYLSRQHCYGSNWHFESDHIELSFTSAWKFEVKRCGFHPVYMYEVEEFHQTTNQRSRLTAYNLNEFHHNFVGSNMEVAMASKRSLTEFVAAAEARGNGCLRCLL